METEHYQVDSSDGPRKGLFTVVAKDPLKALDGDRALLPAPSEGRLSADLTAVATSATLVPAGIGSTYALAGEIAIGGEAMAFRSGGATSPPGRSATIRSS